MRAEWRLLFALLQLLLSHNGPQVVGGGSGWPVRSDQGTHQASFRSAAALRALHGTRGEGHSNRSYVTL